MANVSADNITFKPLFTAEVIEKRVQELGRELSRFYGQEAVLVIGVLRGAFIFTADLIRNMTCPVLVDFVTVSSYEGTASTGKITLTKDISTKIEGLNVLVVEDIADTGRTLDYLMKVLSSRNPKSLKLCTLLSKPESREVEIKVDYCGFEISKEFVIGYGLDLDGRMRELPYIAQVITT